MSQTIVVVDYGMGNLRSVAKAIEHVAPHARVLVSSNPADIANAERVVVPGQGAMPDCMHELSERGLREAVVNAAHSKPFLGICVGLQMLFGAAEEGASQGLGVLPGTVPRFASGMTAADGGTLKVPHMGWNEVVQTREHALWQGVANKARFYFVHSYYVAPEHADLVAGTTNYGLDFACAISRDNLFAVQFHPEKSADVGLTLLANFTRWNP
jgi:imidazole glycerol-phosphate synthase subunit HisH